MEEPRGTRKRKINRVPNHPGRRQSLRHLQLRDVSARDAPESSRDRTVFNPKLKVQAAKELL